MLHQARGPFLNQTPRTGEARLHHPQRKSASEHLKFILNVAEFTVATWTLAERELQGEYNNSDDQTLKNK